MSLPDSFVDRIFARLAVRYGAKWLRLWEGLDMAVVKADWAEVLDGFESHPESLGYALRYLPTDHPPTALQFRDLCRKAPVMATVPKLEAPKADPKRVKELLARMVDTAQGRGRLDWAYDLQSREQSGEILTPAQRMAWRDALTTAPVDSIGGEFTPPAAETLPPGMRGM
jgi:hypothetical protein